MSRKKHSADDGCCSALCRCMFGYFPWMALFSASAVSVFIILWKLWTDPAVRQTRDLLRNYGISNDLAQRFVDSAPLTTAVLAITTLCCAVLILLLTIFKSHQRALQDSLYGQGPMPRGYYWTHVVLGGLLGGLLLALVVAFVAALVGMTLWLAAAMAAGSAAFTADRAFIANTNSGRLTESLLTNYQQVESQLATQDKEPLQNLLSTYVEARNKTSLLQGTCARGCVDMRLLTGSTATSGSASCRCSAAAIRQLGANAEKLQEAVAYALVSLGIALISAIVLLMNLSGSITGSRRDMQLLAAERSGSGSLAPAPSAGGADPSAAKPMQPPPMQPPPPPYGAAAAAGAVGVVGVMDLHDQGPGPKQAGHTLLPPNGTPPPPGHRIPLGGAAVNPTFDAPPSPNPAYPRPGYASGQPDYPPAPPVAPHMMGPAPLVDRSASHSRNASSSSAYSSLHTAPANFPSASVLPHSGGDMRASLPILPTSAGPLPPPSYPVNASYPPAPPPAGPPSTNSYSTGPTVNPSPRSGYAPHPSSAAPPRGMDPSTSSGAAAPPSGSHMGNGASDSLDLKDGWKAIAAKYNAPSPQ